MSTTALPPAARTAGRVFAWALVAVLLLLVAAAAWLGLRGLAAYNHLREAESSARDAAAVWSEPEKAGRLVEELTSDTGAARDLTSDPVWSAAETLPWIGPQLAAVSTVAGALDEVVSEGLAPLSEAAAGISAASFAPSDGRIDLAPFEAIADAAGAGAASASTATKSVNAIDSSLLMTPVSDAVVEVTDLLDTTAATTDALARATKLIPAMLGGDGARDYLVVFQNNAEWRSLGGIVGAMAVIHTDDGAMSMTAQGSSSDFSRYDEPVLDLDPEVRAIYGAHPGRWIQNVTQVPDFSVSGALAREMWQREMGLAVDGVIAMDPVALSYILQATGPVRLATGDELTSENTVQLLLNDVYKRYENPRDQDAFFAAAAAAVFEKLASGDVDPAALVSSLGRAGEERRLLLWSAIDEDQAVLDGTTLVGSLPVTDDDQVGLGVYLNDGTGSKMDYYVDAETTLEWGSCMVDAADRATGELTMTVTITNNAPADAADSLPDYITGGGSFGVEPGVAKTIGYLYLPEGFTLLSAERTDDAGFGGGFHQNRQVMSFASSLAPGESVTATVTVGSTTPGAAEAVAWTTPTIHADQATSIATTCDGT